jgi:hypothetical protein
MDSCRNLSDTLRNERGMPPIGVAIWRQGDRGDDVNYVTTTVEEFLSKPENQAGTWLIDGGWGGPPGPIHVDWDETAQAWINQGFCGHRRNNGE